MYFGERGKNENAFSGAHVKLILQGACFHSHIKQLCSNSWDPNYAQINEIANEIINTFIA